MIVQELMTTDPVTVRAETSVKAALVLLDDHNITSLPVVTAAGRIVDVVSEADLIRDLIGRTPACTRPRSTRPRSTDPASSAT